jgi:hypothetical protein
MPTFNDKFCDLLGSKLLGKDGEVDTKAALGDKEVRHHD